MNQEFRVWDIVNQQMRTVSMLDFINNGCWIQTGQASEHGYWLFGDDEFVLMQYTGMKDENENKIFEGDLLEIRKHSDGSVCEVTYSNGTFNAFPFGTLSAAVSYARVVGNIYENRIRL